MLSNAMNGRGKRTERGKGRGGRGEGKREGRIRKREGDEGVEARGRWERRRQSLVAHLLFVALVESICSLARRLVESICSLATVPRSIRDVLRHLNNCV